MTCPEVVELITDYLEGALPADLMDSVARHLDSCVDCDAYLDQLRWTIEVLGKLPPEPPPPHLCAQLRVAFRAWAGAR